MAPRTSSLYCLIIIASLIDYRAGECLFGCFLRFLFAVCRRRTILLRSRTEMFLVGQPIMADPPPHPPLLFSLREWAHHPLWYVRLYVHIPVILRFLHIRFLIANAEWLKAFVKWLF